MKNKPRVFLYGTNCASVINSLVIGFQKIDIPVKAVSFDLKRSIYNDYSQIKCVCTENNPGAAKLFFYKIKGLALLIRYLFWCDIVHIYGKKRNLHYWIISRFVKNKFVTFLGSEIRVPELEISINPFYKKAFDNKNYEYPSEANNNSDSLVAYLAKLNYHFIMWDAETYINRRLSGNIAIVPHASANTISLKVGEHMQPGKVLIIHSPTAPVAKGTAFVLEAIEKLKKKKIPFEFKILSNLPNNEYQRLMMKADIYIDQLMWGAYGVAAQQAMQMGKVVVAYIAPDRLKIIGKDLPIQNATIDNLDEVLEKLICNPELRTKISEQSKLFYENTHMPEVVAKKMLSEYWKYSSK